MIVNNTMIWRKTVIGPAIFMAIRHRLRRTLVQQNKQQQNG
jgi:hypothetical protein